MRVTSPVGEFPFELRSIRIRGGRLIVVGSMGAWPSTIEIVPRDLAQPALVRALMPVCVALTGYALLRSATRRRAA
jgi:hypothetical protein